MPIDPTKYGRVTVENPRNLEDDEFVFILAGHDALTVPTLKAYRELCRMAGVGSRHLDNIDRGIAAMETWQAEHGDRLPTSEGMNEA